MMLRVWTVRDQDGYELVLPFLIDGDAHSDRDREMFVLGFEFCSLFEALRASDDAMPFSRVVHRENEDRIRLMCGRLGRECLFQAVDDDGYWVNLIVDPS